MRVARYTRKDILVGILCAVLIVMTAGAVSESRRKPALRRRCARNLSGLGKAMLIYANDYEDEFPKAGVRHSNQWVPRLPNWAARNRWEAYGVNPGDSKRTGKVTTTSSLYLLVKYAEVVPRLFVCPAEPETTPFALAKVPEKLPENFELFEAWDFGGRYDDKNNPSRHCSYAYHMPFGRYALQTACEPDMPSLADRNPWMDPKRVQDPNLGWARFDPSASKPNRVRIGNSDAHDRAGQNVLFLDCHVSFEKRPTCGIDDDNIYSTAFDATVAGRTKGRKPRVYDATAPLNRRDSMLVQELGYNVPMPEADTTENRR
jgi:prepilin-type processing-associated H-X9-DG protein